MVAKYFSAFLRGVGKGFLLGGLGGFVAVLGITLLTTFWIRAPLYDCLEFSAQSGFVLGILVGFPGGLANCLHELQKRPVRLPPEF